MSILNKESRDLNVIFTKGGSGSVSIKISLPKKWIDSMNITPEKRKFTAAFDGKNITYQNIRS